jgi:Reverse transcriptase (RNA-dependent DNA polymerase)/RNase H-like domain found in reverse transcriptase
VAENTSPIMLVKKKDGSTRLCVDFRELNAQTVTDSHPLLLKEDILGKLREYAYYSKIDLREAYHQIKMEISSEDFTAFKCSYGTFQYHVMPFGLKNSPAQFQKILERILSQFDENHVMVYLDDILICNKTREENELLVEKGIDVLFQNGLRAKREKCKFYKEEIDYLGYRIGRGAVELTCGQLNKIEQGPGIETYKDLRRVLGMANYIRKFIPGYADLVYVLTQKLKSTEKISKYKSARTRIVWTEEDEKAYNKLKMGFKDAKRVFYPKKNHRLFLKTDTSVVGIGGILYQTPDVNNRDEEEKNIKEGKGEPICFYSKILKGSQQRYSTIERE